MKAIIVSLVVAVSLPSFGQDAPVDLLKNPVSFDGVDIEISEIFEIVGMNLKPTPNVVFKGDAGKQKVHRLRVKDVSLGNLFKVIESVAGVEIDIIDESASGGPSNDPFSGGPSPTRLTSSGVIVVSSKTPRPSPQAVRTELPVRRQPMEVKQAKVTTEVISLAELKIPVESLIEAIRLTWDASDPQMKSRATIAFHEPSKLLIISGPGEAIETAQKTVAAILPSYRELIQTKSHPQVSSIRIPSKLNLGVPQKDSRESGQKTFPASGLKPVPNAPLPSARELNRDRRSIPVPSSRKDSPPKLNAPRKDSGPDIFVPGIGPKAIPLPRR